LIRTLNFGHSGNDALVADQVANGDSLPVDSGNLNKFSLRGLSLSGSLFTLLLM